MSNVKNLNQNDLGTILVVEDEPEVREVLVEQLNSLTPQVLTAENGKVGIEMLKTHPIDAILSDISMPKMNGIQFLAAVREAGYETPFVILTGYADKQNTLQALRLGATDFLDKPFVYEVLQNVMGKALELGKAVRSIEAEIEKAFRSSARSPEEIQKFKTAKRAIAMMRKDMEIYTRKAS